MDVSGFDTRQSYWNPQEVTMKPAAVKVMKKNFSIPTAAQPPGTDPDCACLFPVPPVTSAGRLFEVGPDGISAYNQWSGQRLWNVPLANTFQVYTPRLQVVGQQVVVALTDCVSASNAHSRVFVLDVATGAGAFPAWAPANAVNAMTVANNVIITYETNDATSWIAGYNLSGHQLWTTPDGWGTFPAGSQSSSGMIYRTDTVIVANGLVFAVGADGWYYHLRVSDGFASRLTVGGVVPVARSQDGKDLHAVSGTNLYDLDPATGAAKGFGEVEGRGSRYMAVDATAIYTACAGTALCATARSDGHTLWTVNAGGSGQPVVAAGVVYFAGRAFRATTGARIKNAADGLQVTTVAGGRVYGLRFGTPVSNQPTAVESYK